MTKSLVPLLALLALGACASTPHPPPGLARRGSVLADDGNRIVYDTRGEGPLTLVFVHCWGGNRRLWRHQVDEFAKTCRVVTLDLPGHGESEGHRAAWHVAELGADVARVVEALRLERNVVLVGHSMGGPVSLAAAARLPGRVRAVVGVDTLHDTTRRVAAATLAPILAGLRADFGKQMRAAIGFMFGSDGGSEAHAFVLAEALSADPRVAIALLEDFPALDQADLLRRCGVPVRCVNAAPEGNNAPTNVRGNREHGDFDAVLLPGVGHFLQVEDPLRFNLALAQLLLGLEQGA